jgi:hypothetical protein
MFTENQVVNETLTEEVGEVMDALNVTEEEVVKATSVEVAPESGVEEVPSVTTEEGETK